jgi:hypothetical protein
MVSIVRSLVVLIVIVLSAVLLVSPPIGVRGDYGARINVNLTSDPFGDSAVLHAPGYPEGWRANQSQEETNKHMTHVDWQALAVELFLTHMV